MPGQVFQVVQCYSCHTFQVQQRKKVNKWICKMCGEKQSIKKVYGEGSGADCRVHVQKLNTLRGELECSQQFVMHHPAHRETELGQPDLGHFDKQYREDNQGVWGSNSEIEDITHCVFSVRSDQLTSRWGRFMDDATHTEEGDDNDDNDHCWTTDSKIYKESMKRSMKRKKPQTGTFSYRHNLKGDNPFPPTYTNHSVCSWDDDNSHVEHREGENVTGDELCHKYQTPGHLQLPDQTLQNSRRNTAQLCSESVRTVMPPVQKKQKTSIQSVAVNSKWSHYIDNEESEGSDCSESTLRLGKSDSNPEYDSLGSLVDGQGISSKWSVFEDGVPSERSLSQEDSSNPEASNTTLRTYGNVTGAIVTCYHGDDVTGQTSHRKLSPGDSNGQGLSESPDNNQAVPEHQMTCTNTDIGRFELVRVEGKENRSHKRTSSIFSVGDVVDADLELDF